MVRVVRPSLARRGTPPELWDHSSETELTHYRTDHILSNIGTVQDLWEEADTLVPPF